MIIPEKVEAWTYQELPNGRYMVTIAIALYDGASWLAGRQELGSIPQVNELPRIAAYSTVATAEEAHEAFSQHDGLWALLNDSLGSYDPLTIQ